jgi:two-component system, LytTR family, sensor kinase
MTSDHSVRAIDHDPHRPRHVIAQAMHIGGLFWLAWLLIFVLTGLAAGFDWHQIYRLGGTEIVVGLGAMISITFVISRMRRETMAGNIALSFAIVVPVALIGSFITHWLSSHDGLPPMLPQSTYDLSILFVSIGMYFGWSCLFLTLLYSFDVRDRERRLAAVREEALSAQMRALRYQVNPHFLFNTLNSIAGLIEEGSATHAERMVLSLSTFLRTTLTLDPMHDVPLADEFALQEEYLEIEHQRFSDRMTFQINMPPEVGKALVPSLILQPLVENAIKHGVGQLTGKASISLSARREADRLKLWVENDMPAQPAALGLKGMGIGLKNVAERLRARFQDDGLFSAGPAQQGLYRATLDIPWRTQ